NDETFGTFMCAGTAGRRRDSGPGDAVGRLPERALRRVAAAGVDRAGAGAGPADPGRGDGVAGHLDAGDGAAPGPAAGAGADLPVEYRPAAELFAAPALEYTRALMAAIPPERPRAALGA